MNQRDSRHDDIVFTRCRGNINAGDIPVEAMGMALDDIPVANEMRVAILCLLAIMAVSIATKVFAPTIAMTKPAPAFCFA